LSGGTHFVFKIALLRIMNAKTNLIAGTLFEKAAQIQINFFFIFPVHRMLAERK
jgi:hypothetical protein